MPASVVHVLGCVFLQVTLFYLCVCVVCGHVIGQAMLHVLLYLLPSFLVSSACQSFVGAPVGSVDMELYSHYHKAYYINEATCVCVCVRLFKVIHWPFKTQLKGHHMHYQKRESWQERLL